MKRLFIVLLAIVCSAVFAEDIPPYHRDFFKHWVDVDKDCFDTREEVLFYSAIEITLATGGCKIISGKWLDNYSGKTITVARNADIDHVVPLYLAWKLGAYKWTPEKRQEFANDTENLVVTTASQNRSKGSKTPSQWKPLNKAYWCMYSIRWKYITKKYVLVLPQADIDALNEMENGCNDTQ